MRGCQYAIEYGRSGKSHFAVLVVIIEWVDSTILLRVSLPLRRFWIRIFGNMLMLLGLLPGLLLELLLLELLLLLLLLLLLYVTVGI